MNKKDQDITGKIMDFDQVILDKVIDWAARVFSAAAQRRLAREKELNQKSDSLNGVS